ncbi:MAG: tyrosine-protein phosphatase, partial [Victivallales bacterium]|nr:tyrosine-protein phosphatase [Victivallales bacterium]
MRKILGKNPFSVLLLALLAAGCCSTKKCITLVEPAEQSVIVQHPKEMREFLLLPDLKRKEYFNDKDKRAVLYGQHRSEANEFRWNSDVELADCTVEFAMDRDFTIPAQELILGMDKAGQTAQACNFMSGKTVYWRVKGKTANGKKAVSPVGSFFTEDLLPRQITLPGVDNVRDVGGWETADGRRMRQGLIFRSAGLNLDSPDWQWDEKKRIDPKKSRIGETVIKQEG